MMLVAFGVHINLIPAFLHFSDIRIISSSFSAFDYIFPNSEHNVDLLVQGCESAGS